MSIYSNAIKAYNQALNVTTQSGIERGDRLTIKGQASGQVPSIDNTPDLKPSFPELLDQSINKSIHNTYRGEEQSLKGMVRKAELHEMVTAVSQADLTVRTVVGIRDRIIGAYQDIIKMPI